jgi:hypothetical protein
MFSFDCFILSLGRFFVVTGFLALSLSSCDGNTSKDSEPKDKITNTPDVKTTVRLETSSFPSKPQSMTFLSIAETDFVNGLLGEDLIVGSLPGGFAAADEAQRASDEGVFATLPGLLFSVKPSSDVKVTLSSRGRVQSIKKSINPKNGRVAVSLGEFSEVYPPSFRERYDLTVSSLPGAPSPFSFSYGFILRREDQASVFFDILKADDAAGLLFARTVDQYQVVKLSTAGRCDTCILQVKDVSVRQRIKRFAELPALPVSGKERISTPARFSGVLTKFDDFNITASVAGTDTGTITIKAAIPAANTTAKPWCYEVEGPTSACPVLASGATVATYFGSVNAVPQGEQDQRLGGTSGILNYYLAGKATVVVRRDGVILETKTIDFFSDEASILSSSTLPTWVLDDIRSTVLAGKPEFQME